jgi:hypothetical protein
VAGEAAGVLLAAPRGEVGVKMQRGCRPALPVPTGKNCPVRVSSSAGWGAPGRSVVTAGRRAVVNGWGLMVRVTAVALLVVPEMEGGKVSV